MIYIKTPFLQVMQNLWKCGPCKFETPSFWNYGRHLSTNKHKNKINGTEGHFCGVCDYKTHVKSSMDSHMKSTKHKTREKELTESSIPPQLIKNGEFFHCEPCDYETRFSASMKKHLVAEKHLLKTEKNIIDETELGIRITKDFCSSHTRLFSTVKCEIGENKMIPFLGYPEWSFPEFYKWLVSGFHVLSLRWEQETKKLFWNKRSYILSERQLFILVCQICVSLADECDDRMRLLGDVVCTTNDVSNCVATFEYLDGSNVKFIYKYNFLKSPEFRNNVIKTLGNFKERKKDTKKYPLRFMESLDEELTK